MPTTMIVTATTRVAHIRHLLANVGAERLELRV